MMLLYVYNPTTLSINIHTHLLLSRRCLCRRHLCGQYCHQFLLFVLDFSQSLSHLQNAGVLLDTSIRQCGILRQKEIAFTHSNGQQRNQCCYAHLHSATTALVCLRLLYDTNLCFFLTACTCFYRAGSGLSIGVQSKVS